MWVICINSYIFFLRVRKLGLYSKDYHLIQNLIFQMCFPALDLWPLSFHLLNLPTEQLWTLVCVLEAYFYTKRTKNYFIFCVIIPIAKQITIYTNTSSPEPQTTECLKNNRSSWKKTRKIVPFFNNLVSRWKWCWPISEGWACRIDCREDQECFNSWFPNIV